MSNLFVINAATGEIVLGHHNTSICHLRDLKADLQTNTDELVALNIKDGKVDGMCNE
jgi:hypothetical protein